jgi:hypothetical protein
MESFRLRSVEPWHWERQQKAVRLLCQIQARTWSLARSRSGKSWIAGLLAEQLIAEVIRSASSIRRRLCPARRAFQSRGVRARSALAFAAGNRAAPKHLASKPHSHTLFISAFRATELCKPIARITPRGASGHGNSPLDRNRRGELLLSIAQPLFEIYQQPHRESLPGDPSSQPASAKLYNTVRPYSCTKVEEERYFVTKILQAHSGRDLAAHTALDSLEPPRAGILLTDSSATPWKVFIPAERITRHTHHARKYADMRLRRQGHGNPACKREREEGLDRRRSSGD